MRSNLQLDSLNGNSSGTESVYKFFFRTYFDYGSIEDNIKLIINKVME